MEHEIVRRAISSQAGPTLQIAWCKCGWSGSDRTRLELALKFDDHCIDEDE
jgi:hypothetical protein